MNLKHETKHIAVTLLSYLIRHRYLSNEHSSENLNIFHVFLEKCGLYTCQHIERGKKQKNTIAFENSTILLRL